MIALPYAYLADDDGVPLADKVQANFEALAAAVTSLTGLLYVSTGSPEAVIAASPPAIYLDRAGGAGVTLYVKESGAGNTGWVAK